MPTARLALDPPGVLSQFRANQDGRLLQLRTFRPVIVDEPYLINPKSESPELIPRATKYPYRFRSREEPLTRVVVAALVNHQGSQHWMPVRMLEENNFAKSPGDILTILFSVHVQTNQWRDIPIGCQGARSRKLNQLSVQHVINRHSQPPSKILHISSAFQVSAQAITHNWMPRQWTEAPRRWMANHDVSAIDVRKPMTNTLTQHDHVVRLENPKQLRQSRSPSLPLRCSWPSIVG